MPAWIVKITLFFLAAGLGFVAVSIVFYVAMFTGSIPEAGPEGLSKNIMQIFLGGMMWAWIAGMAAGAGAFFISGKSRYALLWAPVYLPVLYGPLALFFLN